MSSAKFLLGFLLATIVLVTIESCNRVHGCTDAYATNYNINAQVDNGTCKYAATFYFDQNGLNTTVNINNQTATITGSYSSAPSCGLTTAGCANFDLPIGTYAFTASSALSTWSGSVVVNGSGCQDILLSQGSAIFWTASNSLGTITVNIGGVSSTITSYLTGGVPSCGFAGCATFGLAPGVYNYTASSQSGANWSGSVTVTAEGCQPIQLQ